MIIFCIGPQLFSAVCHPEVRGISRRGLKDCQKLKARLPESLFRLNFATERACMKNIKLIEVPSEIGAGTRGASLGVEAIKIAALDFMSSFFVHFPSEKIPHENKLLYEPIESPYAKRIKGVLSIYEKISKAVADALKNNFFPVVLSGDHSIAGGTIAGIKIAKPKSKLGVIWIDAHADIHTPYTTPSGNLHGMSLAVSINEDNIESAVHDLDEDTIKSWNQLKNVGKIAPKVLPEDIVIISIRDYEKE